VTTLTAFTEDAIALGGAAIALVGIVLSRVTGDHIYDAVAAALIGLLLMGFALALAWENKRLLLGESVPADLGPTSSRSSVSIRARATSTASGRCSSDRLRSSSPPT